MPPTATKVDEIWRWSNHYANVWIGTHFYIASHWDGIPKQMEPDKAAPWNWMAVQEVPTLDLFFREYVDVLETVGWL